MPALFISYRRADSPDTVKLICERLKQRLPGWDIFYDHDSIPLGEQFPERLRAKVMSATVILVIVGPKWLDTLRERRGAPVDHVRAEVRLALEAGASVVPVLVGNAGMPTDADLADFLDLQPLLQRNGRPVRPDPDFDGDLDVIVTHLEQFDATLLGKYRLTGEIGFGGMGVVYRAAQTQPVERTVAVKQIKPGMGSPDDLVRFNIERQALAAMDHPNIAKVLDAGRAANGMPFFVMEYVKGVTITQYCDDKKLTPRERIDLFIPVCNAVQHAHNKGIIHRDIKPSNVLVEIVDGKAVPKVIDFGLAKALGKHLTDDGSLTVPGTRVGTLVYSSPEQAAGRLSDVVDTGTDIYSLGVLLYELLAGAPPFAREELLRIGEEAMLRAIREDEPPKPSAKLSSSGELPAIAARRKLEPRKLTGIVKGDLDWIVMKCLEKERARRYETANQVGQELARFLADEPVQAGPPSARYRARKFLRRNKGPVTAAALVLFVLIAGIIGTSIGLVMAKQAAEEEKKAKIAAQESEVKEKAAAKQALASAQAEKAARADADKAADKERQARAVAVTRLKQIEKANALLESIFIDINPRLAEKGGPLLIEQLTRRLLDTADKLDEEAIGDPLTVARLQNFLGNTLASLGAPGKAIELHLKARAAREKLLGPDHPDTLVSMNDLAYGYRAAGKLDLALPLYEETLKLRKAKLGPDHLDTLISKNNLASTYQDVGKLELALPLYEETLKLRKAKLGPDHPHTLMSMNSLAVGYQAAGKPKLALPLFEETLKLMKAKLGPGHPDTLISMNNLAYGYQAAGKLDLSLPLYEETLKLMKGTLGPDHPNALASMNNLAYGYRAAGKLELALPLFEEILKLMKAKLGPDHPNTLLSMNNLANVYQDAGKLELALPLYEETLKLMKGKLGPDHPNTFLSMNNLASGYVAAGKLELALPLFEELLKLRKAKLGSDHPDTLLSMNNLASVYQDAGKLELALPLYEEALKLVKGKLGADHPSTLLGMNNLASGYLAAGKLELALPLYEETLKLRKAKLGPDHPDTFMSMNNLAYGYQGAGKLELALPLYEETLKLRKGKLGPHHPDTLMSINNLAVAYLADKRPDKATPLFEEYLAVRRTQWGANSPRLAGQMAVFALDLLKYDQNAAAEPMVRECLAIRIKSQPDAWSTFNTKAMLGGSLLGQKKYQEAEPLLKEGYEGMKAREKTIPPAGKVRLTEALERLVQLYEAAGNAAEAEHWREELGERKAAEKATKK